MHFFGSKNTLIKALIFDLGNVILQLNDEEKWESEIFKPLFDKEKYTILNNNNFFERFECGLFDESFFIQQLQKISNQPIETETIIDAWNAKISHFPDGNIETINALKYRYRIFLLSNTNSIHEKYFIKLLISKFGENIFDDLFETCFYSHHLGQRKPNADIFETVLKSTKLQANECLFLDDNEANITAALSLGFETLWIKNSTQIQELYE